MLAHFLSEHHFKLGSACCLHFHSIHVCFEQKPEYFLLDPTTDAIRNESQVAMCSRAASKHFSASFLRQPILAMSRMNVSGTAELGEGLVTLQLAPSQARPGPADHPRFGTRIPRPTGTQIIQKVNAGEIPVHPSRHPMSCQDATHAMGNIQRVMLITPGARGDWYADADQRLGKLLAKPKAGRALLQTQASAVLAIVDTPGSAVPEPAVPEPAVPEPAAKPVIAEKAGSGLGDVVRLIVFRE